MSTTEPEAEESSPGQALATAINQTGLSQTVKSRFQQLILRLIAGGPGYEYYKKARERLDEVEGRSRISNIVADELGRQALLDPEFMGRAKARFLGEMAQKQENLEAVAAKAEAKVEDMPDAEKEDRDPSDDWMNTFTREAELASSDELRERLASVLAGEARKPGTYSRSSVRLIAELEKDVLESFQRLLTHRVGDAIVREDEWNSGAWFASAVELEAEGFLTGSQGFTHRKIIIGENGIGFMIGQKASLTIIGKPGAVHEVSILLLTRVGQEVASLLAPTNEFASITRAGSLLKGKDGIDQIWFGPHTKLGENQYHVLRTLLIWDREHGSSQSAP